MNYIGKSSKIVVGFILAAIMLIAIILISPTQASASPKTLTAKDIKAIEKKFSNAKKLNFKIKNSTYNSDIDGNIDVYMHYKFNFTKKKLDIDCQVKMKVLGIDINPKFYVHINLKNTNLTYETDGTELSDTFINDEFIDATFSNIKGVKIKDSKYVLKNLLPYSSLVKGTEITINKGKLKFTSKATDFDQSVTTSTWVIEQKSMKPESITVTDKESTTKAYSFVFNKDK